MARGPHPGRLAELLALHAHDPGLTWTIVQEHPADQAVAEAGGVVSSDAGILDRGLAWCNLGQRALAALPDPWIVNLRPG